MNQKLLFVSIIAIVAVFATSAIAVGLSQNVQAASSNCKSGNGINVNVCGVDVCANVAALAGKGKQTCSQ
jgi:hypothetical protein